MSNLLITGGAGFIGSHFCHYACQHFKGCEIWVLDKLTYAGHKKNILPLLESNALHFIEGDINDEERVFHLLTQNQITKLVHFAAESHVDQSIAAPDAFITTNINGTHALLKAAKRAWLDTPVFPHRFHHVSTDEVFGSLSKSSPASTENDPYRPNSPYSASKAAADHLVRAYHQTYGLDATISYCTNNLGTMQLPEKLIPKVIRAISEGKPIPVYGDGQQVRDWIDVTEHCRGIDVVLSRGKSGEAYNIGANNQWTNIQLVHLVCEITDSLLINDQSRYQKQYPKSSVFQGTRSKYLIAFVEDRPGHDQRYALDTRKLASEMGFQARFDMENTLRKTIEWYLNFPDWWEEMI